MKLTIASIAGRARSEHFDALVAEYVSRTSAYTPAETAVFRTSQAFFESLEKQRSRTASALVLLDSRGKKFSSEELASWIGRQRDEGRQRIIFAVGPADGWSRRGARTGGSSPVPWPHDPSARTGPGGPERAGLPGIYNPCWAPVPHGALRTGRPEQRI